VLALFAWVLVVPMAEVVGAQPASEPKRVLVLYWYNKDFIGNSMFDQAFQAALKSAPGSQVEYYAEYLETDRFPGEAQVLVLRDHLRAKYAGRKIDVVVGLADPPLNFLLKYRNELFPNSPIVFNAAQAPAAEQRAAVPGITGLLTANTHKETLDLALKFHPNTKHVFVISGTPEHDKRWETRARQALEGYDRGLTIDYLTDLPLGELLAKTGSLPENSLLLYAWQQSVDPQDKLLESRETLALVAQSTSAPIYGMSTANLGHGIIGGYVVGPDTNGARIAETVLRILNGERARDIPVASAPSAPEFDWHQLRRWGIDEKDLPPGSTVLFREYTFLERYRWQVITVAALVLLEAALIVVLLTNRFRRVKAEKENVRLAKLAEQEHELLAEFISNLPGVAWETRAEIGEADPTFKFVSDHIETMLGYNAQEFASTPGMGFSIISDEDRDAVWRSTQEVLESRKKRTIRFRCVTKDGRLIWAESHMAPAIDDEGRIVGLRGVTLDITEHMRAEAGLRENRMQLEGIITSAMDAIISIDDNQCLVLVNPAAEKMFGYTADELKGLPIDSILPGRFRAAHEKHNGSGGATNGKRRSSGPLGTLVGRRASGHEFPIEASISQLQLDGRTFYTAILRDITDRIRAQEALNESEQRFRTMADTAPVMIWISGTDKRRTYFNQQWLNFTGRTIDRELGDGWTDVIHPDDFARCLDTYDQCFDRRQQFTMEYRLLRADGQFRWVIDTGTPRLSPSGEFLGYIGSCLDITEQKGTEEALMDLSGHLIRAQEDERSRLARELHDDLNQRMALVSVSLERLRQNPPDTPARMRQQLQAIMDQTVDISKEIHRMSYDLHPSWLVHVGLVAAVRGLCEELLPRQGLRVEFTHEGVPTPLPQDVSLCLYRIVQECLSNVVKHSGAKEARVQLTGIENEIRLRVSDSGRGFDIDSRNTHHGLGLISMRERLRLVGGNISIESRPSEGTQICARVALHREDLHEGLPEEKKTQAVRAE
jgi:PAS domain S-box-containing protein